MQIADWREAALNELLTGAWDQYKAALGTGDVLELEAKYESFVAGALAEVIDVSVDREAA